MRRVQINNAIKNINKRVIAKRGSATAQSGNSEDNVSRNTKKKFIRKNKRV